MLIASQKTSSRDSKQEEEVALRGGRGRDRGVAGRARGGLWTYAVGPVMHRCRWIVLHKLMMSERETCEYTHRGTKTNRLGDAVSPRGPRLQSTLIIADSSGESPQLERKPLDRKRSIYSRELITRDYSVLMVHNIVCVSAYRFYNTSFNLRSIIVDSFR